MSTTNHMLANKFINTYPMTNRKIQDALIHASQYIKNVGKISFWSGEDKGKKYLSLLCVDLGTLIEKMSIEHVITESIESKEDVMDVLKIVFNRYQIIYPNWQKEYNLILTLINEGKDDLINMFSDTIDDVLNYKKMQKSQSNLHTERKHTLDTLVFSEDSDIEW